jgi:protocatechuate 3,4-dioxygenase beta subunit
MMLSVFLTLGLAMLASAHPGDDPTQELEEHRAFLASVEKKSLSHCAEKLKARGVTERNVKRRMQTVKEAREKRGIKKRDLEDVLKTNHNKTDFGYTPTTPADVLFEGANSCVLTPEVILGPYYVSGEAIRRDVVEGQEGVPLIIDYQLVDIDTCEPIPELYLEIWHANSTGVYSGVVNTGNGDINDVDNIDKTWARGIQPTDEDGVAQFETFFPGHYLGRATHIHVLAHANATRYENETLGNLIYSSHVGQTYFDQDLIDEIEKVYPYTENKLPLTTNAVDMWLAGVANQEYDPVVEYTLLGDTVSEGLFAWLAYGINVTATAKVTPAVFLYEDGGHPNPDFSMGPPGGGPPGGPPGGGVATE